jgi:signal transduction histidine kinase
MPADIRTTCFRIAQEALANAARHARASEVKLHLKMAGSTLELTVSDNGAGFDVERYRSANEREKHFGLVTMEERAGLVGGRLDIDAVTGRGTRIQASFPVRVNQSNDSLRAPSSAAAPPE